MDTTIRINGETHNDALLKMLEAVYLHGIVAGRRSSGEMKELTNVVVTLPPERNLLVMPGRGNNPIATLFEVAWVFNDPEADITTLKFYLPRAEEFSDDGRTWRGGYGPRVLEQFQQVEYLLRTKPDTRQAVIQIHNGVDDTSAALSGSRDIPCNLTLHFQKFDGRLCMAVFQRSMDALWGSNVNFTEWTTLQQIFAQRLQWPLGSYTHFIANLHLYPHHFARVRKLLTTFGESEVRYTHYPLWEHRWVNTTLDIQVGNTAIGHTLQLVYRNGIDAHNWFDKQTEPFIEGDKKKWFQFMNKIRELVLGSGVAGKYIFGVWFYSACVIGQKYNNWELAEDMYRTYVEKGAIDSATGWAHALKVWYVDYRAALNKQAEVENVDDK